MKEPFIYEVVTDAGTTQQLERALEPFFVRRNTGLKFTRLFAGNNMLASAGWYNDWWVEGQKFSESGNDFVARLTGLAQSSHDGADYTHLGIGLRYVGAGEGTLQFKGRPENHVSAVYVDTGSFAGDHALNLDLESVWNRGPLYVTAELARSWVSAPNAGNPRFWGAYGIVSYVLTGEHRPYDKKVGYARRILPAHKWGAWELVARYSHVDLMDQLVDGGIFDRGTIGLNWWATRRWRLSVDYGVVNLDRKGLNGLTRIVHTRLQWTF
jgi:phosphate-selective porin OprO/OprP